MIDLLEIETFLDAGALAALAAEMERAGGGPATVLSQTPDGAVRPATRRTTRLALPPEVREEVKRRLMDGKPALEKHFGVALGECEEPQFLRYQEGDFFVAHQDGNTPLVWDESRFRRVSAVVFLNPQAPEPAAGTYGGGELVFHGPYTGPTLRVAAGARPGSLVAFRAETTHEVLPVTHGVRYTIAAFFRAPA
ncbi:2OG-Fe(II) oxygenase [Longimicrobium sp.]|uniref:2OG-Fe(II) oxygenase n=1 Tax=Longimicrobium sp. TaxID=2029185 RepID=UPI002C7483B2|nr:2OG-Fe(II) oxygenase [Longimicrobium sp.]HSU17479.1 2OG-Fe(II) oxygenase [Longimicrobium sp.]